MTTESRRRTQPARHVGAGERDLFPSFREPKGVSGVPRPGGTDGPGFETQRRRAGSFRYRRPLQFPSQETEEVPSDQPTLSRNLSNPTPLLGVFGGRHRPRRTGDRPRPTPALRTPNFGPETPPCLTVDVSPLVGPLSPERGHLTRNSRPHEDPLDSSTHQSRLRSAGPEVRVLLPA